MVHPIALYLMIGFFIWITDIFAIKTDRKHGGIKEFFIMFFWPLYCIYIGLLPFMRLERERIEFEIAQRREIYEARFSNRVMGVRIDAPRKRKKKKQSKKNKIEKKIKVQKVTPSTNSRLQDVMQDM